MIKMNIISGLVFLLYVLCVLAAHQEPTQTDGQPVISQIEDSSHTQKQTEPGAPQLKRYRSSTGSKPRRPSWTPAIPTTGAIPTPEDLKKSLSWKAYPSEDLHTYWKSFYTYNVDFIRTRPSNEKAITNSLTLRRRSCEKLSGTFHEECIKILPDAVLAAFRSLLKTPPKQVVQLIREFWVHEEEVNECRHELIEDFDGLDSQKEYQPIQLIEFIRSIVICMKTTYLGETMYSRFVTSLSEKEGYTSLITIPKPNTAENRLAKLIFELLSHLLAHDANPDQFIELYGDVFVWCSKDVKLELKSERPKQSGKTIPNSPSKTEDPEEFRRRRNVLLKFMEKNREKIYPFSMNKPKQFTLRRTCPMHNRHEHADCKKQLPPKILNAFQYLQAKTSQGEVIKLIRDFNVNETPVQRFNDIEDLLPMDPDNISAAKSLAFLHSIVANLGETYINHGIYRDFISLSSTKNPQDILAALVPQFDTTESEFLRLSLLLLSQLLQVESDEWSLVETFGNIFLWGSFDLRIEMAEKSETDQTILKTKRTSILQYIARNYNSIY